MYRRIMWCLVALPALAACAAAQAPVAAGILRGKDVTVEHAAAESSATPAAAVGGAGRVGGVDTPLGNGSVIEVHSGKARVQLAAGGVLSICGPAKFTLLDHNGALTLALEFGTVHVTQPGDEPLQIFTPFFAASPESMAGASREFTIGLQPSGRLCARAQEGAVRLEQQLTGNVVTVPEPGEIYLEGGGITAQKNDVGHCVCDVAESDLALPAGPAGESAAVETPDSGTHGASASSSGEASRVVPSVAAGAELSVPAHPAPSESSSAAAVPPEPAVASPPAEYNVQAPPLTYSYKLPYPPPNLNAETVLLARESRVETSEVFHGHVGAAKNGGTPKAGSGQSQTDGTPSVAAPPAPATKPRGFWTKLKHFFGGGKSNSGS